MRPALHRASAFMSAAISNVRPKPDRVLVDIANYVLNYRIKSKLAYETARNCLIDTLGCALGGYDSEPVRIARAQAATVTSTQPATILCSGERTSALSRRSK